VILLLLANPAPAAEYHWGQGFYLGDLHAHTGYSLDGGSSDVGDCPFDDCAPAAEVLQTARGFGLDFVSITDHVNGGYRVERDDFIDYWKGLLRDAAGGAPLLLPGVELRVDEGGGGRLGHKNLLLFGEDAALAELALDDLRFAGGSADAGSCEDLWVWAEALAARAGPLALIPHHTATLNPVATDWSCHDDTWQLAAEVYSEHGNSLFNGTPFDPPLTGTETTGTLHHAMNPHGYALRLGFIASTDTHDSRPGDVCTTDDGRYGGGLAVAVLPEHAPLDRAALYDALRARRVYATSGPMLPAAVSYRVDGAEIGAMGDDLAPPAGAAIDVEVRVPEALAIYVDTVTLIEPAMARELFDEGGGSWTLRLEAAPPWIYVRITVDGESWYGAGACEDGGASAAERIWLSPSWIDPVAPPADTGAGDSGGAVDSAPAADSDAPGADSATGVRDSEAPAVDSEAAADSEMGVDSEAPATEGDEGRGCGCGGDRGGGLWALTVMLAARRQRRSPS